MTFAALYDIHGNLPALREVLREVRRQSVDAIVIGGDVVLGPMSGACLELLQSCEVPPYYIKGNCEMEVVDYANGIRNTKLPEQVLESIRWTAQELSAAQLQMIDSWPWQCTLKTEVGDILFCHATPRSAKENFTSLSGKEKLMEIFGSLDHQRIICGHTHVQFEIRVTGTQVSNAGSVGMPSGTAEAQWLLIDDQVRFMQTGYDLEAAARTILGSGYPGSEEFVQSYLRSSQDVSKLLDYYK